ncbi:MAG: AMP-binding protein [Synechococcaceae cyanobacterium]|nr:AMP-binding protein [Synechococcaceae cyanobacterium]
MTSGSTGTPKGVAVGHPGILRLVDPANGFLLAAGAKVLQFAPVAFDAATFEIWGPLLNGGTLVVAPPGPLSLSELARELRFHGITTLWLTALAGVRQVLAGGEVLAVAAVRRLLAAFPPGHGLIHGYGPTEATTFTCCHALAAGEAVALLERGARIGLLALLDTEATARIHRRLGVVLLAQKLLPRVRDHGRALLAMPAGQGRRGFLRERVWALRHQVKGHLGVFGPAEAPRLEIDGTPLPAFAGGDPFVRLLEEGYRPPRLPLRVDLFTPPAQIPVQRRLWRFYARAGVRLHPLFKDHFDFLKPERMPQLAAALEGALADIEATL